MIELDKNFFDEEIRDGYLVTQKVKKIWAIELDLLNELLRVCQKYNIKIISFAGTMLGAIRHNGFIPWDDDIDVCLTREEYNKLLLIAEEEFKEPYFFQTALNDRKYFFGYARLRNSNTTGIITTSKSPNYNNGIYIDVFVVDSYIEDKAKLKVQLGQKKLIMTLLENYYKNSLIGLTISKIIKYESLYNLYVKIMTKYENRTDRVTLLTHTQIIQKKYWFNRNDLNEIIYVPYETLKIPIPRNYDEILRHMYGNYKEFPPVEKRGEWHKGLTYFVPDVPYKEFFMRLNNDSK